jgi:hypothetical protein
MNTWHSETTWEEFANTAPCKVRPEWRRAFKTPAVLYFSLVKTLEDGVSCPIETTINFLKTQGCPEEIWTMIGVILMGIDDLQPNDALWISPNTPWRVSPTTRRLQLADNELMEMNQELKLIRHRLVLLHERTGVMEKLSFTKQEGGVDDDERNAAALLVLEPKISITLMLDELKVNGMHWVVRVPWRDVYARGGIVMYKHDELEYKLTRGIGGDGNMYIGRPVVSSTT